MKIISIIMNSGTWDDVVYHVKNGNWEMWINFGELRRSDSGEYRSASRERYAAITRSQVPVNPSYGELRKTADSRNEILPNTQRDNSIIRDIVDHGRNADCRISIPVIL